MSRAAWAARRVMCGRHRLMPTGILGIAARIPAVRHEEAAARDAARACLDFVGLRGAEDLSPAALSFGHQRLVEIARALALEPVVLLMDEPASGLNDTETERLAELILHIAALGIAVVLVEHDMQLVMQVCDMIHVLDFGRIIAVGTAADIQRDEAVLAAYLGTKS